MNKFQIASIKERQAMESLFNQNNINHYYFTDDKGYDRVDGYYTAFTASNQTKEVVFEVKNRDVTSNQYRTTIIDKDKIDYIIEKAIETNNIPYLYFFFKDNKYLSIELKKDNNYSIIKRTAPSTTMGNNQMRIKEFVEFPIENLIDINLNQETISNDKMYSSIQAIEYANKVISNQNPIYLTKDNDQKEFSLSDLIEFTKTIEYLKEQPFASSIENKVTDKEFTAWIKYNEDAVDSLINHWNKYQE